ncbi:hypothetical protein [Rubricoccus marinus]|uniref:DUF1439 domain-containing protein n=1 Tax=Rubricoccus marinus TaxID=716817 RepID=A0A259TXF7_9BACT|nr:hypothetical protein [Rubricoccus marinus]OZC02248.1 hypothetical protein BSZ36_04140 [Rubricoccus marinus]
MLRSLRLVPVLLALFALAPGCTTLQQIANFQNVDFDLDRVSNGLVAGVDLDRLVQNRRVGVADGARITAAALRGEVPLSFTLFVGADNPTGNPVAQVLSLDWTMFLDGTETINGTYNETVSLQPGQRSLIPIDMELDLVRFFGNNAGDIIDLIGDLAGDGSQPSMIRLQARPTVNTALGPIRYPGTISIEFPVGSQN